MIQQLNRRYRKTLSNKQITYHNWVVEEETSFLNENKSKTELDNGCDLCILHSSQGRLSYKAEEVIRNFLENHPTVQLVYGDEDVQKTTGDERSFPWFKPDWSPDTFQSFFYLGSVIGVRKDIIKQLLQQDKIPDKISYEEFGSNEVIMELIQKIVLQCGGFAKKSHINPTIAHIPFVLYHCKSQNVIESYLSWNKTSVIKPISDKKLPSTLSIIIPSKDNISVLKKAISSILEQKYNNNIEVLIIDNGSSEKNKEEIEKHIKDIYLVLLNENEKKNIEINYIYEPMEFNFSKMCNKGAHLAKGEFLLFLNDDVTLCQQDTLTTMVEHASAEYTGMVGLKLYYPDSVQIQHAGISNLPMGPVHKLQFLMDDRNYYFGRNTVNYNVLAVTGACFMIEKRKFIEVGCFFEQLQVAFNDVDICFSLEELGYYNVLLNSWYAYHHESLSRGGDETEEKLGRLMEERTKLYTRHPQLEGKDPYYPYQLNHDGLDTRIRPAYITAKNYATLAEIHPITDIIDSIEDYRQDACLLISIEQCNNHAMQGYAVVLGDDNACYDKQIILKLESQNDELIEIKDCLIVGPLLPQYRPDLEENMKDQQNVALSGFSIKYNLHKVADQVTPKKYRVGIIARHKITKTKLINWTNTFFPLV